MGLGSFIQGLFGAQATEIPKQQILHEVIIPRTMGYTPDGDYGSKIVEIRNTGGNLYSSEIKARRNGGYVHCDGFILVRPAPLVAIFREIDKNIGQFSGFELAEYLAAKTDILGSDQPLTAAVGTVPHLRAVG